MSEQMAVIRERLQDVFDLEEGQNTLLQTLGVENDERQHTRLLKWLLKPDAMHGAGIAFRKALASEVALEEEDLADTEVEIFVPHIGPENAEIDTIIRGDQACIGIEIKTARPATEEQLTRELDALREHHAPSLPEHRLIYLTHDPDSSPSIADDDYRRMEWGELADVLEQRLDKADQEWVGFLGELFVHLRQNLMKPTVNIGDSTGKEAEKAAFYAHLMDFVDQAKSSYDRMVRQFLREIDSSVQERTTYEWVADDENPWEQDNWETYLNDNNDFDNGRIKPRSLDIYNQAWPCAVRDDTDELLTARFDVHVRNYRSGRSSTAQQEQPLSSAFGVEVNFDLFANDHADLQEEARTEFMDQIPSSDEFTLERRGYIIDISTDAEYHIVGKLIESEWPPDVEDVDSVMQELNTLMDFLHEPVTEVLQNMDEYDYPQPFSE